MFAIAVSFNFEYGIWWSRYVIRANLKSILLSWNLAYLAILSQVYFAWSNKPLIEPVESITNAISTKVLMFAKSFTLPGFFLFDYI